MSLAIYKPGQGKWTRVGSGVGFGIVVLATAGWVFSQLDALSGKTLDPDTTASWWDHTLLWISNHLIYVQSGSATAILLAGGLLLYWVLNKPAVVDFLIATETEMRKVNWPSWREIRGSTQVVIVGTLLIAALLFVIDIGFALVFSQIGILEGGGGILDMLGLN